VMIIIKREVRNRGSPGIVLVEENFVEEMIGRVSVKMRVFWRLDAGHSPGCKNISAPNGILQNRIEEMLAIGLITGSNEVKRSGVILGSTSE